MAGRGPSGRGLLVVTLVLVIFLAVVDLTRPDSLIRSVVSDFLGPRNRIERTMRRLPSR